MEFFEHFTSNTLAGSGNQLTFTMEPGQIRTSRIFYKITYGGNYRYSLLFSNIVDSTYADGTQCHKNHVCGSWHIHEAKIGRLTGEIPENFKDLLQADPIHLQVTDFVSLSFGGCPTKTAAPGEFFASDPIPLTFDAGDYLCLELTFSGREIPYHEETLLPVFSKTADGWRYDNKMPFPGMIGCDRPVERRIGYLGDSITQGIGPAWNSYQHWNARLAHRLGDKFAHWNLGLGYARADDMASCGAWMYKALHNDLAIVCYGVNDLGRGFTAAEIMKNLETIVDTLNDAGITVILQTIPPFDYTDEILTAWHAVNSFIQDTLSKKVAMVFDTIPILGDPQTPQRAIYGGHPNEEGSAKWAEVLYEAIEQAGILR